MPKSPDLDPSEGGYALLAAVTAVAAFGYLAFQVLAVNQGGTALVAAQIQKARLEAAADAGLAIALQGVAVEDRAGRWSIDGRTRDARFDGVDLAITVEDERGKVPLATLTDAQARALFFGAGATGEQLEALVSEYRNWVTDPATGVDLVTEHLPPSNGQPVRRGPMLTVSELAALPDMTAELYARIAPVVTVFPGDSGPFRPANASPLARAAMAGELKSTPDALDRQARIDRQKPEEDLADEGSLTGQALTIRVVARDGHGGVAQRAQIVELTGDPARPYWVRYAE
jgi:general secretion pathway protein K